MASSDFLSWDDDIDLDILLEEYTDNEARDAYSSDSEFEVSPCKKKLTKSDSKVRTENKLYACPLCDRQYKSISGFRSHTKKQHNKPGLKGKLFKQIIIHDGREISDSYLCVSRKI